VSGNEQSESDITLQQHCVRPIECGRDSLYLRAAELNCQNDPGSRGVCRRLIAGIAGSYPVGACISCFVVAVGSDLCDRLISRSE